MKTWYVEICGRTTDAKEFATLNEALLYVSKIDELESMEFDPDSKYINALCFNLGDD